jgi:uroporphyrinogen-III synthase
LPRAEEARDVIIEYINSHGGVCHVVPVYRTGLPKDKAVLEEVPDIITFTSSSTVHNFIALFGKEPLRKALIASIGPITSRTLDTQDIDVHIEAERYDIPGLVEAIEKYHTKRE